MSLFRRKDVSVLQAEVAADQSLKRVLGPVNLVLLGIGAVGYHGVFDQEKRSGQPFFVDLVMYLDLAAAGASDDVALTAHYGEVAEEVRDIVIGPSVNLLETLADQVARRLLARFPLDAVEVTVHKPKAPIEVTFSDVSVTIYRER